jgi:glyoxylase-like metal-dependent hydrolase (beta-lactamase superfamily II)
MHQRTEPLCIDLHFQGLAGVNASWLVSADPGWVIVDCGPSSTLPMLEQGVAAAGLKMRQIDRIVLTHIHLDHGGGTGALLRKYPHLRVTVHRDSAGILVDPSRLIRSATISYGDMLHRLWGDILPVDSKSIDVIEPAGHVPGTSLRAVPSPGHTATHLSYLDERSAVLFTGDAAHARLQDSAVIVPTLSPVEVDIDAWSDTADVLRDLDPSSLALPHFGLVRDAATHLARIEDRIQSRMERAASVVRTAEDVDALASALADLTKSEFIAEGGDVEAKVARMELAMPSWLGAQGIMRWYKVHNHFSAGQ